MEESWKATTAGILGIIAGAINVFLGLAVIGGITAAGLLEIALVDMAWLSIIGIPLIVLGVISIVGGGYALKRRLWGLAFAGAICAILAGNLVYGTLSIILLVLGKGDFQ